MSLETSAHDNQNFRFVNKWKRVTLLASRRIEWALKNACLCHFMYEICWEAKKPCISPCVRFGYKFWHFAMNLELRFILSYHHHLASFTFVALIAVTRYHMSIGSVSNIATTLRYFTLTKKRFSLLSVSSAMICAVWFHAEAPWKSAFINLETSFGKAGNRMRGYKHDYAEKIQQIAVPFTMFSSKWKLPPTACLARSDIFNTKLEGLKRFGQQVIDPKRRATQVSTKSRLPKEGPPRQNGQGWKICTCSLILAGSTSAAAFACSLQLAGILIRWRYKLDGV